MILDLEGDIPFSQKFSVDNINFELDFYYRLEDDSIICDLKDANGNYLSKNNSIRYNEPLFSHMMPDETEKIRQDFPQKLLVPVSINGEDIRVGLDTFLTEIVIELKEAEWYTPTTSKVIL